MSDRERIAALVQRHGIDGVAAMLADYCEDQAGEYEDTPSGAVYGECERLIRRCSREMHDMLVPQ